MSAIQIAKDFAASASARMQEIPQQVGVGIDRLGRQWRKLPNSAKIGCAVAGTFVYGLIVMQGAEHLFGRGAPLAIREQIQTTACLTLVAPVVPILGFYINSFL